MTKNEINTIIGEFMGLTVYPESTEFMPQDVSHTRVDYLRYAESLDALVPVWKKLRPDFGNWVILDRLASRIEKLGENDFTIQWAAALVTAKTIKDL